MESNKGMVVSFSAKNLLLFSKFSFAEMFIVPILLEAYECQWCKLAKGTVNSTMKNTYPHNDCFISMPEKKQRFFM